jgi:hypothetical protein
MQQKIVLATSMVISLMWGFAVAQGKSPSISFRTAESFAIHILDEDWESLGLGYTSEKSWPILQSRYKHATLVTVTSLDIGEYHWVKQRIILTAEATESLNERFKIGGDNSLSANLGIPHRAFVVTVDGQPVYGGIFLDRGSQMAVRYPVIYAGEDKNGLITMDLRPAHSTFELDSSDPAWEIVRPDCIHDIFARAGKLAP